MGASATELVGRTRRVIIAQIVVGTLLAVGLQLASGLHLALSAVFGVLVGTLLTLLLSRSVRRAGEVAGSDPKRGMAMLYIGAVQRFFFVIAALALGMAVFGLNALAIAGGFVCAQFAQLVNARNTVGDNDDKGLK